MKAHILLFFILMTCATTVSGFVSSGGNFVLDRSLSKASHQVSTAGAQFDIRASIGESFWPISDPSRALRTTPYWLFEGFLGIPLKVDPSQDYAVNMEGSNDQIMIPGGVIPQSYEPMLEPDPASNPITSDPNVIAEAQQKLVALFGPSANSPLIAIELRILLEDNTLHTDSLTQPIDSSLSFQELGNGGDILINHLDENTRAWTQITTSDCTPGSPQRTCSFTDFSTGMFGIFQTGPINASKTYAYPVPWRPNAGNTSLYGTQSAGITFTNLPNDGKIQIYNIAGELVRDIIIPSGMTQMQWNAKTGSGNDVASGVYIWSVESNGNHNTGKLMIIR